MIAEAWRDLAGLGEGMVCFDTDGGRHVLSAENVRHLDPAFDLLPDPDAPSNHGVWLAWCARTYGRGVLDFCGMTGRVRACVGQEMSPAGHEAAAALLYAVVQENRTRGTYNGLPDSVRAWWEAR